MPKGGARPNAGRPKGQGPYKEATKPVRLPVSLLPKVMQFVANKCFELPLYSSKVQAGFPSPADDHLEKSLDLNEYLVKHPAATFFVKATGDSMIDIGINENDILVVDRSIKPTDGKVVIAAIDGQLTVKRLKLAGKKVFLIPENKNYPPIEISNQNEVHLWGVVTSVIHTL